MGMGGSLGKEVWGGGGHKKHRSKTGQWACSSRGREGKWVVATGGPLFTIAALPSDSSVNKGLSDVDKVTFRRCFLISRCLVSKSTSNNERKRKKEEGTHHLVRFKTFLSDVFL